MNWINSKGQIHILRNGFSVLLAVRFIRDFENSIPKFHENGRRQKGIPLIRHLLYLSPNERLIV